MARQNGKSGSPGLGVGAASILVVFVLLCLVTFSVLSLVSANADRKLAEKNAAHTLETAETENSAEEILAEADSLLAECYAEADSEEAYYTAAANALTGLGTLSDESGVLTLSYSVDGSSGSTLQCEIEISYPAPGEGYYTITRWQTEANPDWTPNQSIPVFGGTSNNQ